MQSGTLSGSLMPPSRKPLRDLGVQRTLLGRLVAGDEARREAVGVGRAGLRDELRPGVVVGEDAVEDLLLVLAEVVVAQAGRSGRAGRSPHRSPRRRARTGRGRSRGPRRTARPCGAPKPLAWGCRSGRSKPAHQQALAVVAVGVAVEAAGHPLQAGPCRRTRRSSCVHTLAVGGVVERRVERVDVLRQADRCRR